MSSANNYLKIKLDEFEKEHNPCGKLSRYDGDLKRDGNRIIVKENLFGEMSIQ